MSEGLAPEGEASPREKLDWLDTRISILLSQRNEIAGGFMEAKSIEGQPVYDPAREDAIVEAGHEALLPVIRTERLKHATARTLNPALPLLSGGTRPKLIAGPCSVESQETAVQSASMVRSLGIPYLRGGCWKPRTAAASWQGAGDEALGWITEAAREFGLGSVVEVVDARTAVMAQAMGVTVMQVGARNAQNYELLKTLNSMKAPVLLKRGPGMTVEEWLGAASYLEDCPLTLCERGVASFENSTRNMLDMAGAVLAAMQSGRQVIIDPSHATGSPALIKALAPAIAALRPWIHGAIIEFHPHIPSARTDQAQALDRDGLVAVADALSATPTCNGSL
tara:strand:- start:2812 stop:3825 length:1014 start_codon:yes stop_codon:yes gene_type:complete